MKWHTAVALPALLLAACTSQDAREQAGAQSAQHEEVDEEELARWRGRWRCLSRNEEGTLVPQEEVEQIRLTVGGTLYHFQWGDDFDEFGRYVFHPSENPKAMDIYIEDPPDMKGRVVYLIYRMDGDRLLLSHREDNVRPTDFVAEPESGQTVERWERIRPGEDDDEEDDDEEDEGSEEEQPEGEDSQD